MTEGMVGVWNWGKRATATDVSAYKTMTAWVMIADNDMLKHGMVPSKYVTPAGL